MTHTKPPFKREVTHGEVREFFEDFKDDEQSHGMNVAEFIGTLIEKHEYAEKNKTKVWVFGSLKNKRQIKKMIEIADKIL